ncbi:MAG: phosphonate C-P lyase system protein PhnK [Calothrix sp. SM1_7_51]|nr:phosphonate C-P lyase system protein PhnK [Calothrix sp. SM1_7_51]
MNALLKVDQLNKSYGAIKACDRISFDLFPGEILGIVGESGSGKSTLLNILGGKLLCESGGITYRSASGEKLNITQISETKRRLLMRTEWGFVQQNPRDGLLLKVSAGGNIGERLLDIGVRNYGKIRTEAFRWLCMVEIDPRRIDDLPNTFSGGMQQRLQLARVLVTHPKLILMDEPTGGLDVSVQAKFLDLLRTLVREFGISVILVTHDIGVVRLLAHRLLVIQHGRVIESGLTDQVLDDPQHSYTQLLVSAALVP